MKRMMQSRNLVAVVVASTALLGSGKAFAFGDECHTWAGIPTLCETLAIRPNSSTHTVNMKIHSSWTTYQMVDVGNDFIIREGRTGGGWHYETIGGLYNSDQGYRLS